MENRASTPKVEEPVKAPLPLCYNCGSPHHPMPACPEPTKEVPYGLRTALAKEAALKSYENEHGGQYKQNSWNGPGHGPKKYQGAVVTKYPASKAPVITRYAQPSNQQSQHIFGTYPNSNLAPNPPAYLQQPTPVAQTHGQYGQNYGYSTPPPPPPPPPTYNHYGQPGYPGPQAPPPPPHHPHYQPQYPAQPPTYNQQAPHQYSQYPVQPPPYNQQAPHQQSQYPLQYGPPQSYQNGQQYGQPGSQGYHQANAWNQQAPNGYQQSAPQPYQHPPAQNYNQQYEQANQQPPYWEQPADASYAQQQNGQGHNGYEQPYYPQPQSQYPQNGNHNQSAMPFQHGPPPPQQPQQYGQAQYASGPQQYDETQWNEHHYHEGYENQYPNSQSAPYPPQNTDQPTYPQPNHELNSAMGTRSNSAVSQMQGSFQQLPPPDLPQISDEEEIEWMLEKHLTVGMKASGLDKSITDLTTDEYYTLLCESVTRPCDPIGEPLPDKFDETLIIPPRFGATGVGSKFITADNVDEFKKSVRDQPELTSLALDPLFSETSGQAWQDEFTRWVDRKERIALGLTDAPLGPKSLKRSSGCEEDSSELETREGNSHDFSTNNHNKRTRFNDSSYLKSKTSISSSTLATAPIAERSTAPFPHRESTPVGEFHNGIAWADGSATPSISRDITPAFDLGEDVPEGENDPWAVEPGEGSVQVDNQRNLKKPPSMSPNVSGRKFAKPFNSQKPYYNKNGRPNDGINSQPQPYRRDSGYVSARGSRNSSTHNSSNGYDHNPPQGGATRPGAYQMSNQQNNGYHPQHYNQVDTKRLSPMSSDSDHLRPGDSPLTPTSAELLGHTILPLPDQGKANVKPKMKQGNKRKQPQVESAYSRRW